MEALFTPKLRLIVVVCYAHGTSEDAQTQLNNSLFKSPVSLSPFLSLSQDQSDPDP